MSDDSKRLEEAAENRRMEEIFQQLDKAKKELAESNEKWLHKFGQYNDDIRRRLGLRNSTESTQEAADRVRREADYWKIEAANARSERDAVMTAASKNVGATNVTVGSPAINIRHLLEEHRSFKLTLTPQDVAAILAEAIKVWFPRPMDDLREPEPKFKVGDRVMMNAYGQAATIFLVQRHSDGGITYIATPDDDSLGQVRGSEKQFSLLTEEK